MENTVELLGYYGDDKTHACSAWTSIGGSYFKRRRHQNISHCYESMCNYF